MSKNIEPTPTLGYKWSTNSIFCRIMMFRYHPYVKIWREAAKRWNDLTNFELKPLHDDDGCFNRSPCLQVKAKNVPDATYAGHTTYHFRNGYFTNVTSLLNRKYTDGYSRENKLSVAGHELGHAMGLDHHPNDTSIMTQQPRTHTSPQPDDVAAINSLYPLSLSIDETRNTMTKEKLKVEYMAIPQWAVVYNNTNDLKQEADVVISGVVTANTGTMCEKVDELHTYCTQYTISVNKVLKSEELIEENQNIIVKVLGGTIEDISVKPIDAVTFSSYKNILIFLKAGDEAFYLINENTSVFIEEDTGRFKHLLTGRSFTLNEIQSGVLFA
ncbi:matrixin family metalloprotease [Bacillus cereus]